MGRKRQRRSNRREVVIGMIGPMALAVALGLAIVWWQRPVRLEVSLTGAQAQSSSPSSDRADPASVPHGAPDPSLVATVSLPDGGAPGDRAAGAFRTVCCRRADNTAYWTAAEWCDDVGAAVDEKLCEIKLPEPVIAAGAEADGLPAAGVPSPITYTQCLRMAAEDDLKARLDARCALLLETVCCEQHGRVTETPRGECQEESKSREVDPRMCEPVCCHRPAVPSVLWDNRGNCGDASDRGALVVAEDKCEEVCCQMPDRTMRRDGRRACITRGGTSRATSSCGTTVTIEGKGNVDADRARLGDEMYHRVDLEVDERLPAASPFM
jgi:hypothetical protein